ncbi:hypothetical protein BU25DRAFT_407141 [Macroventuria anomochaeta]|uniref:Uncharacterized protein n=1 Tax=Macroventuria anomochaeta TaxID=301207 RepID=A0ACB6SBQ9_9PLEO|nr:uncharacterized protein BU25DRAFT_407141 [Macroventuria anomochaeta]KAF2631489.1 hypothetical protein BU25DRAFT_407141 [Macroventuria anomochaeta]
MPIFGSHSNAVTPPKSRLISGPMHARHVGGVSITGGTGGNTSLDSYFAPTSLEPDELPSHTYAASGKIEVPRRSNTFTNAVRRPSLSLKRSISRLRGGSGSQGSEGHKRSQSDNRPIMTSMRSDPAVSSVHQAIQRKPSPIPSRPNTSLDWDVYTSTTRPKSPETDAIPEPPPKDYPRINSKISMYSSSAYSAVTDYEQPPTKETPPPLPVRPRRADSGTAIEFDDVPAEERPMGFKEIAAMQSYKDRMALYEKTRDYWANAEHGLAEWTGRTGGPRTVQLRREENWL